MSIITKKKSFSVLIPDGESNNTLSVVRCLGQEKNINVFVLSKKTSIPVKYSRYISKFIKCKIRETDKT